ncbi:hypothetical protein niasHT_022895 [Heterodera trifolii]|uniref:Uncharacterized protein n=1 Tax=Heterodera trifolii TaxID=157864 RepID=A0ABD2KIL4_9BILA
MLKYFAKKFCAKTLGPFLMNETPTLALRHFETKRQFLCLFKSASRGSSASGQSSKKKGGTAKLLELGPLRFMAKDTGKVKLIRQDSQRPGLRAMLYGLTLKMEREEKLQKKLLRKRARKNCRVRLPPADEFVPADVTGGGTSATAACGVIASGNATLTFAAHPLASDPHVSGGGGYARRLTSPLRAFGRRLRQQSTTSRTVDDLFADEDTNSVAGDAAGTNTPKRKPSSTGTAATTASAGTGDFEQSTLRQRLLTTRIQWSKDLTIVPADDEAEMKPKQQKLARIEWTSEEEEEDEEKPSSGDEAEAENSEEEEYVQKQQAEVEAVHRDRDEEEEEEEEPDDTQFASHPSDEALLKAPEALPSKAGGPTRMSKSRSLQEMIRHYWSFARSHGTTSATTANGGIGTPNRKESLSQRRRSRLCAATAVGTSGAAGSAIMPRARSTDERLFAALASHTQQLVMPQFLYLRSSHSSVFQASAYKAIKIRARD